MTRLLRRLHYLLNRRRLDNELAEEMEFHREMAAKSGGMPMGDALRLREDSREAWGWTWIDRLGQDLRYSFRMMRTSPGFSFAAVLVLGIGIGATVAAFSAFNMIVLRKLPIRDPDTILRFQRQGPKEFWSDVPYTHTVFYREHAKTLSTVLALTSARLVVEEDEKSPITYFVTSDFLSELGASARVGRIFTAADDGPQAPPVVVLGHGFWQSRFAGDPLVVGKTIHLNGKTATIIGVAAQEFSGLGADAPGFWAMIGQHPYFVHGSEITTDFTGQRNSGVVMWGRLCPGATAAGAETELATLAAQLRQAHPDDVWEGERLPSEPGGYAQNVGSTNRGSDRPPSLRTRLYPIFGLVGALVLLIFAVACGNLGSLLLARGAARQREMSIRVSVGAGAGRLIRQLFTESLVLAAMGSIVGLVLGSVVLRVILVWTDAPAWLDPSPDARVVFFALAVGCAAAIFFGLTPALHIAKQKARMTFGRTFLIGAQVASSCVLLIVAGLLIRAFDRVTSSSPGFEYQHVISIDPDLGSHGYSPARARTYIDDLRSRLLATPGVESVGVSSTPPLGGSRIMASVEVEGRQLDIYIHQVDASYLSTMKIPIVRGRDLAPGDTRSILVSESMARRRWPNEDALGKPFSTGSVDEDGKPIDFTVVGVAGSARSLALKDPEAVEMYRLVGENGFAGVTLLVRTAGAPETLTSVAMKAAKALDPEITPRVQLLKTLFRQNVRDVERSAFAVTALGVIALLVACLGIVGLVAYAVSQRTKEIGIRMALGAEPTHILTSLAHQFQRTVVVGLIVGVAGAAALSQALRRELYGLSTLDPVSYIAAVTLFIFVVGLAALLPARKALRVDPLTALRCD
ncbi:MAG: ABC transporter permease [Vicinamibacteria bacterium]